MSRGKYGVWYYFLAEYDKKESTRYKFVVDGIWTDDQNNFNSEDDNNGSLLSISHTNYTKDNHFVSYKIIKEKGKKFVEFRTFNPKASYISVAGDFNRWNPENDVLTKDASNIWRIKKHLPKGKYRYSFIIDGEWKSDTFNPDISSDPTGKLCSIVNIDAG